MTPQEALDRVSHPMLPQHRTILNTIPEKPWKGQMNMQDIQKLRELTKASISDCKTALEGKSVEAAVEWLKKKGIVDGLRLQGESKEGAIHSYIHTNGKVGVLLDVGCQTDFVARTEEFKTFCKDVCLHIAGASPWPRFVEEKDVAGTDLEGEQFDLVMAKTLVEKGFAEDVDRDAIPAKQWDMIVKIAAGRISKWKQEICLLSQKFVKDPTLKIADLVNTLSGITKEKIIIRRFTRYEI